MKSKERLELEIAILEKKLELLDIADHNIQPTFIEKDREPVEVTITPTEDQSIIAKDQNSLYLNVMDEPKKNVEIVMPKAATNKTVSEIVNGIAEKSGVSAQDLVKGYMSQKEFRPRRGHTNKRNGNKQKVVCINNGLSFESMKEASERLMVTGSNISLICSGTLKADAKTGLIFRKLTDEPFGKTLEEDGNNPYPVIVRHNETGVSQTIKTIGTAGWYLGVSRSVVTDALSKGTMIRQHWSVEYVEKILK